jgi:ferredoxin
VTGAGATDGRWRIDVDRARCIGSGMCVGTAPGRFELDGDSRSHPVTETGPADQAVLDAAASCPVEAITVVDTATGEAIDPFD